MVNTNFDADQITTRTEFENWLNINLNSTTFNKVQDGMSLFDENQAANSAYYSHFDSFHKDLALLDIDDIYYVLTPMFFVPQSNGDPHSEWCMDDVTIKLDRLENKMCENNALYPNMDGVTRAITQAWYQRHW